MLFKKTLLASALLALGGFAISATGATNPASASFQIKLTIAKACSVTTSGPLDLGTVDSNQSTDATANASNISVTCSKKLPYSVGLTPSSSSTDGTGTMKGTIAGNTDTIAYALYQNAGNTTAWGNTASNSLTAANGLAAGTGSAQTYKVYGKVLSANLNVMPDSYSDSIAVNVTY